MGSELLNMVFTQIEKVPPFVAFTVNPELGPFLVSSSRSFLWRPSAKKEADGKYIVLSATRTISDNPQAEILAALVQRSLAEDWGNVFEATPDGFEEALGHMNDFEGEIDVLVNTNDTIDFDIEEDLLTRTTWVPPKTLIVVPRDRRLLGDLLVFERTDYWAAVVYNAMNGLSIIVEDL